MMFLSRQADKIFIFFVIVKIMQNYIVYFTLLSFLDVTCLIVHQLQKVFELFMTGNNTKYTKTTVFLLEMQTSAKNCEGNIYIYIYIYI